MEDNKTIDKTIDMEINADTTELDEAIDKAETLQEALAIPSVIIRAPKYCTINIYAARRPE